MNDRPLVMETRKVNLDVVVDIQLPLISTISLCPSKHEVFMDKVLMLQKQGSDFLAGIRYRWPVRTFVLLVVDGCR